MGEFYIPPDEASRQKMLEESQTRRIGNYTWNPTDIAQVVQQRVSSYIENLRVSQADSTVTIEGNCSTWSALQSSINAASALHASVGFHLRIELPAYGSPAHRAATERLDFAE
jgi:hypothetical protein